MQIITKTPLSNVIFKKIPQKNPIQIVEQAIDKNTNKVLGSITAVKCNNKLYSHAKFPEAYVQEMGTYYSLLKKHIYIRDLGVEKKGIGIGRKLIQDIVMASKNEGCEGRTVLLAANPLGRSPIGFYRKMGFSSCSKTISNKKIDTLMANKEEINRLIQCFMCLPKQGVEKILRAFR